MRAPGRQARGLSGIIRFMHANPTEQRLSECGIRPTARNLAHMSEQIPGGAEGPNNWGVIGISRDQWRLVAASAAFGGNVRVGLEDNFYLPDGEMARSNGDLIAKAREMTENAGRRAATVAEARELLGLPAREISRRELLT